MAGVQPLAGLSGNAPAWPVEAWQDPYQEYASPADAVTYGQYTWEVPPPMPWLYAQQGDGWAPPPSPPLGVTSVPAGLGPGMDTALAMAPIETGSHHAPWPATGLEDGDPHLTPYAQEKLAVMAEIHAHDTGQDQEYLNAPEPANPWQREDVNYLTAGQTELATDVPDQLRGNMGRDHTQGFQWDASYGFNQGMVRMPGAKSDVPGNWVWLDPARRPVEIRPSGHRDWPVGEYSPFTGQVPGTHGLGDPQGAVIDYAPPEYLPPAEPAVSAALPDTATWSTW